MQANSIQVSEKDSPTVTPGKARLGRNMAEDADESPLTHIHTTLRSSLANPQQPTPDTSHMV